MDEHTIIQDSRSLRVKDCEVCGNNEAKYTCPRCEVRTCCLECVKIHKKELECSGIRDKVKFKLLKNLNNIDLLNDYRLLEETARLVKTSVKLPSVSCYNPHSGILPTNLYRFKCAASKRGIQLHFLPPSFSQHQTNTSYLDYETQELYWRVDWVFVQAENATFTDERILDSNTLSACIQKYIEPDKSLFAPLSFYQAAGHSGIKLLLKAERITKDRFYMLDPTATLRENLNGKSIIEHPVVYVVLSDHEYMFNIVSEEEEEELIRKQRRRQNSFKKSQNYNNFFFPNPEQNESGQQDEESEKLVQSSKSTEEIDDGELNFKKDHNFTHHRGRGHFRKKWNGRGRGRGRGHHGRPYRGRYNTNNTQS